MATRAQWKDATKQVRLAVVSQALPGVAQATAGLDSAGQFPQAIVPQRDGAAVRLAAEAIGGHRVVVAVGNECVYADNTDAGHALTVLGVSTAAVSQGAPVAFQVAGEMIFDGWSFTPGEDVWVGENGMLTQTPPVPPAAFSRRIASAWTPTLIRLRLGEPVFF